MTGSKCGARQWRFRSRGEIRSRSFGSVANIASPSVVIWSDNLGSTVTSRKYACNQTGVVRCSAIVVHPFNCVMLRGVPVPQHIDDPDLTEDSDAVWPSRMNW